MMTDAAPPQADPEADAKKQREQFAGFLRQIADGVENGDIVALGVSGLNRNSLLPVEVIMAAPGMELPLMGGLEIVKGKVHAQALAIHRQMLASAAAAVEAAGADAV